MDEKKFVLPLALGVGLGSALGVATDNLAICVGLGTSLGLLVGLLMSRGSGPDV